MSKEQCATCMYWRKKLCKECGAERAEQSFCQLNKDFRTDGACTDYVQGEPQGV